MFFPTGLLCPELQCALQPCCRSRCSSPRNILAWERKRKEMDRPPFAINLSACLGRMVALALLPVMLSFFTIRYFLRLCHLIDAIISFPFPLPPCNETVYAVLDYQGRGGVSDFCLYFNLTFALLLSLPAAFCLFAASPLPACCFFSLPSCVERDFVIFNF